MCTNCSISHEAYIAAVAETALGLLTAEDRAKFADVKLVYGAGHGGIRGITYYNRWQKPGSETAAPFVEVSAFGQESVIQLAGTTIHELGHVLAGWDAGHGPDWKAACHKLGLRKVKAAGTNYVLAMFAPAIRSTIARLPKPDDGAPVSNLPGFQIGRRKSGPPSCKAGIGTRGGVSRGPGSGSRLRKFVCPHGAIIRAGRDDVQATCNVCGGQYVLA